MDKYPFNAGLQSISSDSHSHIISDRELQKSAFDSNPHAISNFEIENTITNSDSLATSNIDRASTAPPSDSSQPEIKSEVLSSSLAKIETLSSFLADSPTSESVQGRNESSDSKNQNSLALVKVMGPLHTHSTVTFFYFTFLWSNYCILQNYL